jgi:4-amino-4-deoxy-L-arabinose transferase-like glycosyltransferase
MQAATQDSSTRQPDTGLAGQLWVLPWRALARQLGSSLRRHLVLGWIAAGALAVRLAFIVGAKWHQTNWNDGFYYHYQSLIVAKHGQPLEFLFPGNLHYLLLPDLRMLAVSDTPDATHPPGLAYLLAAFTFVGVRSGHAQLILNGALSALAVIPTFLVAQRLAGRRAAYLAAGGAALYPGYWVVSGQLTSETLALLAALLVLHATYRLLSECSTPNAIYLGLACAVAALSRSELVLALPLIATFFLLRAHHPLKAKVATLAISVVVFVAAIAPWSVRNLLTFHQQELLSTQLGFTMLMANCDLTYYAHRSYIEGESIEGYWIYIPCGLLPAPPSWSGKVADQSDWDHYEIDKSLSYIRSHLDRFPIVVLMRVGRIWQLFDPVGQVRLDFATEQWNYPATVALFLSFYLLAPLALFGAASLIRAKRPLWPLAVFPLITTVACAFILVDPRYRVVSEPSTVILAAAGLDRLLGYLSSRRSADPDEAPLAPQPAGRVVAGA